MKYKVSFQDEIKRYSLKRIVRSIFFVMALFYILSFVTSLFNQEIEANNNLEQVSETFVTLYQSNVDFLLSDDVQAKLIEGLQSSDNDFDSFQNYLNRFNLNQPIKSSSVIVNADYQIQYASVDENQIPANLVNYIGAINFSKSLEDKDNVSSLIYRVYQGYSNLMLVKTITHQDSVLGAIAIQINGADWSYYALSHFNHDAVITDSYNNTIFYNRPKIITNHYTFAYEDVFRRVAINDDSYWMVHTDLAEGFKVYSMVYSSANESIALIVMVLLAVGLLWYLFTSKLASSIATMTTKSVNTLVSEINTIRYDDIDKRIAMDSQDEFQYIGEHINELLDTISSLNIKNTQLLELNNQIEIANLTAQFNPHFLYNTLETIRNCVYYDKELAESLIMKLNSLLRYSIDHSTQDSLLKKDLKYMDDYFQIQKTRFEDRFTYHLDIDDECLTCMVPKLVLQPIVENSLKYGFKVKHKIHIDIIGKLDGDYLILTVRDNGMGIEPKLAAQISERINQGLKAENSHGLYNIARQLQLKYPAPSHLKLINQPNIGLIVQLIINQKRESKNV